MDWYVLHVLTGCEAETCRQLKEKGFAAAVIQETETIRRGGKWHYQPRIIFPGYVFVHMDCTPETYYTMQKITGAIRLLPKGSPQPLRQEDAVWIAYCNEQELPSAKVEFGGGAPRVIGGLLKVWEDYIVKFDRHRRRAQLRIPILGEHKDVTLSFEPV